MSTAAVNFVWFVTCTRLSLSMSVFLNARGSVMLIDYNVVPVANR